jgi:hypothetical protein
MDHKQKEELKAVGSAFLLALLVAIAAIVLPALGKIDRDTGIKILLGAFDFIRLGDHPSAPFSGDVPPTARSRRRPQAAQIPRNALRRRETASGCSSK